MLGVAFELERHYFCPINSTTTKKIQKMANSFKYMSSLPTQEKEVIYKITKENGEDVITPQRLQSKNNLINGLKYIGGEIKGGFRSYTVVLVEDLKTGRITRMEYGKNFTAKFVSL